MNKTGLVLFFLICGLIFPYGCQGQPAEKTQVKKASARAAIKMEQIRQPAVAGTFYPANSAKLDAVVGDFLQKVPKTTINGEITALISPHAGYVYSGGVAAYAYKLLEGLQFETVVVIAPSHYHPFMGASIYNKDGYRIPLGVIPIDQKLAGQIASHNDKISFVPKAHAQEHSLEVQLPFLKKVLGDFKLAPIIIGSQDMTTCKMLAEAIAASIKCRKALIVASSDLSHFHSYKKAVELDKLVIDRVEKFDPEGLYQDITNDISEACGAAPIITALLAAKLLGADRAKVLKYANSGDVTGDISRGVVGYMAAAIYKKGAGAQDADTKKDKAGIDMGLSQQEKNELRRIARTTIEQVCRGKNPPDFTPLTPTLNEKRGAFVTLHKKGRLRGCIGYIQAIKPLYSVISEMAAAAALKDPRFTAVNSRELDDIEIEISALTPMRKINNIDDIVVGKHGIYIKQGFNSGLLLPQVATENNWDRLTFIKQTCFKAGLPYNAWQDNSTEIHIFSADIF